MKVPGNFQINFKTVEEFENRLVIEISKQDDAIKGLCLAWVVRALARSGLVFAPSVSAWEFFSRINEKEIILGDSLTGLGFGKSYIDNKSLFSTNLKDGLLFGNYPGEIANRQADSLLVNPIRSKIERVYGEAVPITHVGIAYRGIFYHVTNKLEFKPTPSFRPIASWPIIQLLRDNKNRINNRQINS